MSDLDQIQNFLQIVCSPAEQEIKIMSQDVIKKWKLKNVSCVIEKARLMASNGDKISGTIQPKVALSIIDNCSKDDEDEIQELWAGIFISSIMENPTDENVIFANLLNQLSLHEARIIKFMCETCIVNFSNGELPVINGSSFSMKDFFQFTGECSITYIEGLVMHMNSLRLNKIIWGHTNDVFRYNKSTNSYSIHLTPTVLCMNFYLKCIGFKGTIKEYFKK